MATIYKYPQWLMPENSNKDKVSNYSFEFDGSNDYIGCGDSDNFSFGDGSTDSPFTLSAWVRVDSLAANRTIVSKDTLIQREYGLFVVSTGVVRFYIKNQGGHTQQSIDSTTTLATGTWYHVAATYNGVGGDNAADGLTLYINGSVETPTNITKGTPYVAMNNTSAPFQIGRYGTTNLMSGSIDNIAVYATELSSSNISTIYNSGEPTTLPGTPIAHYKMGEQSTFTNNWLVNNSALSTYSTRSFDFDGVDDYIELSSGMSTSGTNWSISFWFRSSQTGGNRYLIGQTGSKNIAINWSKLTFISSDNSYDMTSTNNMNDGNWHNAIYTYNYTSGAWKSYIDGVIDDNQTATAGGNIPSWKFFGARSSTQYFADCNLDEIAYFETELSASDVTSIYNSGTPTDLSSYSPKGWWRMGEDATFNTNWSLPDNGSGSNTGTSANMGLEDVEGNDAPNYYGGGLSVNMTIEDRVGNAPNSNNNALSYNMTESDRETDVPS